MKLLILNTGSNSLKFDIVDAEHPAAFGKSLVAGSFDNIGKPDATFSLTGQRTQIRDHGQATEVLLDWIQDGSASEYGIPDLASIDRVGHRVVHGANLFAGPAEVTDDVLQQVESLDDLAPLHNGPALKVMHATRGRARFNAMNVAVFDTVFHQSIPDRAALYALPKEMAERHHIRRYGFHGVSHRYMAIRYAHLTGHSLEAVKLITLHLEGGSSACAIDGGQSVDTSMGFTPLEGLMMGTRCGDLDPAIVTYLMRKENMDPHAMDLFLNKKCGLAAVSQMSADTRELVQHLDEPAVELALDMFCYRVQKYIGAYLAALGGVQAIIAGGGIAENTSLVRERVFKHFAWAGATLDPELNEKVIDREGLISRFDSKVQIWVIPTKENLMIAKDVANFNPR